jgi:hypothetical protein
MAEQSLNLNFFHGALLDEDADKLLVNDGDFLPQSRSEKGSSRLKLFLAIKKKQIRRFELVHSDSGYSLLVSLLVCLFIILLILINCLGQAVS